MNTPFRTSVALADSLQSSQLANMNLGILQRRACQGKGESRVSNFPMDDLHVILNDELLKLSA